MDDTQDEPSQELKGSRDVKDALLKGELIWNAGLDAGATELALDTNVTRLSQHAHGRDDLFRRKATTVAFFLPDASASP